MKNLVLFDRIVCEVVGFDSRETVVKVRALSGTPFDGGSEAYVDDALLLYPSFAALHGGTPVAGKDYPVDGHICQDDYEYLTGQGPYSDEVTEANAGLVGSLVERAPIGERISVTALPNNKRG